MLDNLTRLASCGERVLEDLRQRRAVAHPTTAATYRKILKMLQHAGYVRSIGLGRNLPIDLIIDIDDYSISCTHAGIRAYTPPAYSLIHAHILWITLVIPEGGSLFKSVLWLG